jgi:phosphoglucosamine mutase
MQSGGATVVTIGVAPSAAVAYLTARLGLAGGAVITASHNPAEDNGVKFFSHDGAKLSVQDELRVESLAFEEGLSSPPISSECGAPAAFLPGLQQNYLDFLRHTVPPGLCLRGTRILVDAANGAAGEVAAAAFEQVGAAVDVMAASPDGANINSSVGAVHPEEMARRTLRGGFDIGLALDGDGDRAVFADEKGRIVDGDQVLCALALDAESRQDLANSTVVGTVLSNRGLERRLVDSGIRLLRAAVGDRNILAMMRNSAAQLGGETSGHYLFGHMAPGSDGLLTGIQLLALLVRTGRPASDVLSAFSPTPQVSLNLPLSRPLSPSELTRCAETSAAANVELGGRGTVIVRPSGTEPLLRIMVDADVEEMANAIAARLASALSPEANGHR